MPDKQNHKIELNNPDFLENLSQKEEINKHENLIEISYFMLMKCGKWMYIDESTKNLIIHSKKNGEDSLLIHNPHERDGVLFIELGDISLITKE